MIHLVDPVTGMRPSAEPVLTGPSGRFGWSRKTSNGAPRYHRGVDFSMRPGQPVFASTAGICKRVGEQSDGAGFGQRIYLYGKRWDKICVTIYAHLSGQNVEQNEEVRAGHLLGWAGRSGNLTDEYTHLHYETRTGGDGRPNAVNPLWFLLGDEFPRLGMERHGG